MVNERFRDWVHGLRRPQQGRLLAGVCVGLADRIQIDVTLLRLGFLLLALASGVGLVLYMALWLMIPPPAADVPPWRSYRALLRYNLRGIAQELRQSLSALAALWHASVDRSPWPWPLTRRWLALGLVSLGVLIFLQSLGFFAWLGAWRCLGLALIALGGAIIQANLRNGKRYR